MSLWQQRILRETSFYICVEKGGNITLVCFLLLLKREKKCLTLQSIFSICRLLAFLPVTLSLAPVASGPGNILSAGAVEEDGQGVDVCGTNCSGERGCSGTLHTPSR